ncbi:hypothetical protein C8J55DRAFT_276325 [Lentinula edodes]|uniref:F-box domain-containing protein n=1 Tax=Lentinula lateritia TaxID=40482 RepID=A0A9W9DYJ6_9AGAR|nr:hypothetical protein C8J55DRAFT_276325 [Lentinula edodes]
MDFTLVHESINRLTNLFSFFPPMAMQSLETGLDSLPLELLEVIISFVDRRTLPSCALVCKRWIPASRGTLFSSLALPNDLRTRTFLNLLDNDTPSTFVDARIKHLDLSSSPRSDVGSDSERVITSWASRTPKTHAALHAVFGHLTSLSVRFTSVWVTPEGPEKVWFRTITSLRLEFVVFEDQQEFQNLIKSLPFLESLELSSVEVTHVGNKGEMELEAQSQLASLSIAYIYDPATIALIAPFCGSLRKFEYDWHSQQYSSARSLPGVGAILRAAGRTLEELSLKTGSWAEGKTFDEGIDALFKSHLELEHLPSLHRLALDISIAYLLPILRRLASAYDARHSELSTSESQATTESLPSITHLYIPAIGYKSSFRGPNDADSAPANDAPQLHLNQDQELLAEDTDVQPTGTAPVFHDLNKNLHEALEVLLPIHPVFGDLVELRCDADDLYNAADFAMASSTQFFQSQYYWRMQAKEAAESDSVSSTRGVSQPYSTFVPFRRTDTVLALGEADADAEADAEVLTPTQFSLGSASLHRYPRPGTLSHSRLRLHVRKLRKHMPLCAAKGITPIPVVRYWFNDVPTGLVFEERMWASGDGYASITGVGNWDTSVGGPDGEEIAAFAQAEEDVESMGGMQGLSMRGMEIWDTEKGRVLIVLFLLSAVVMLW